MKYRTGPVPRASSQDIKSTSPLSPDPDNKSPAPTSVDYPPHLPPTLFYGNLREPLIITPEDGGFASLGGKLPSKDLTVADVARLVGPEHMVDVIGNGILSHLGAGANTVQMLQLNHPVNGHYGNGPITSPPSPLPSSLLRLLSQFL